MVAFLFAGQGSQYIGMGKDLYDSFPQAKAVFEKADQALGFSLKQLIFSGAEEALKNTSIAQPAILTVTIAAFEAFKASGKFEPAQFNAGLSLGEYSALVAAEVLDFSDAVRLVRRRAELMNESALRHPGKMAAVIGLEREKLKNICLLTQDVELANLNCPGQIVISGKKEAVDKAKEAALGQGAKRAIDLEVSGAFHSGLMLDAAMEFKHALEPVDFKEPKIPVVNNVEARPEYAIARIKENLVKQIYSPVFWEDSMKFIVSNGIMNFIEFGPGKVLKGLMRKIEPAAAVISIEKKEDILNAS